MALTLKAKLDPYALQWTLRDAVTQAYRDIALYGSAKLLSLKEVRGGSYQVNEDDPRFDAMIIAFLRVFSNVEYEFSVDPGSLADDLTATDVGTLERMFLALGTELDRRKKLDLAPPVAS